MSGNNSNRFWVAFSKSEKGQVLIFDALLAITIVFLFFQLAPSFIDTENKELSGLIVANQGN